MGGPTARRLVKILHELSAIGLTSDRGGCSCRRSPWC